MTYLFNLVYLLLLVFLSPWLLYRIVRNGRYRRGLGAKFLGFASHPLLRDAPAPDGAGLAKVSAGDSGPTVWFHGVSVGEIHLLRQVVALARQRNPHWRIVVSASTDTGYDEALKAFPDLAVIFWPLDFSWAVKAALRRVRPDLVVLAEGEIWPNFLCIASGRGIKVALLNGRMSPRSFRRFRKVGWVARSLFGRFDRILAQNAEYGEHYQALGGRDVRVTGNVKYDGAASDRNNPRTLKLRQLFGIHPDELVWVAGSTQAPEEEVALAIYRKARERFSQLRLILVPRAKDRFAEVALLLDRAGEPFVRRSGLGVGVNEGGLRARNGGPEVILVDTIGELSAVWGLADVAFVGGSLDGQRGGQNMIEPAAYGAAVTFGPHTWNFKDTVARLLEAGAALQVQDASELEQATLELLGNAGRRLELGHKSREFVLRQQGATERSMRALEDLLEQTELTRAA